MTQRQKGTLYESLRDETGAIVSKLLQSGEAAQIAHSLQERVKELTCLYGISELINAHGSNIDRILQGVADILPESWQFPEVTCSRVRLESTECVTRNFSESVWVQAAPIRIAGRVIGSVEVYYVEEMPDSFEGPFLKEERLLIDAIADRLSKVIKRIRTEEQLELERTSLKNMNIALNEVLKRVREEKNEVSTQVQANVDQVVMPILYALEQRAADEIKGYATLLRQNLEDIVEPFTNRISQQFVSLSPTEIQICNMIRKGLSSKEIGILRGIAPSTVSRHREHIRRKLGIAGKDVNLSSYLASFAADWSEWPSNHP